MAAIASISNLSSGARSVSFSAVSAGATDTLAFSVIAAAYLAAGGSATDAIYAFLTDSRASAAATAQDLAAEGGMLAGIGGAFYSLAIVSTWVDGLTKGAGWIAIALVIFGFWRPDLTLVGAYLFGALQSLGTTLKARSFHISGDLLDALPFVMTIVVLVLVSSRFAHKRLGAPAALGVPYEREER